MKLKVWLDSGANAFSCYTQEVDTEKDFGLTDEEWEAIPEDEKYEDYIKEIAFSRADWGFEELD